MEFSSTMWYKCNESLKKQNEKKMKWNEIMNCSNCAINSLNSFFQNYKPTQSFIKLQSFETKFNFMLSKFIYMMKTAIL